MAKELYAIEPIFREQVDLCAEILRLELGLDLRELLYPEPELQQLARTRLSQTQYTQPALFVVEYALARTWMKWGLQPDCMIGHSIGEYASACLAGVFSLQRALHLVSIRGRLMQQSSDGAMTSVMLSSDDVRTFLPEHAGVSLAAINGPSACAISGPTKALVEVEQKLAEKKVPCRRLHVGCAPHSSIMDSILPAFRLELEKVQLNPLHVSQLAIANLWTGLGRPTWPYISPSRRSRKALRRIQREALRAEQKPQGKEKDSAVWAIDLDWLEREGREALVRSNSDLGISDSPDSHVPDNPKARAAYVNGLLGPGAVRAIIRIDPLEASERMVAQQGVALCKLVHEASFNQMLMSMIIHKPPPQPVIRKLKVGRDLRIDFLKRLQAMNIHRASLFPGLDGFGRSLKMDLEIKARGVSAK